MLVVEFFYELENWFYIYCELNIYFCECKLMWNYLMRENLVWWFICGFVINKYFIGRDVFWRKNEIILKVDGLLNLKLYFCLGINILIRCIIESKIDL